MKQMTGKSSEFQIIAIDGPGGVGKSSLAKILAERLGFYFLSTGLIYRAMAWFLGRGGWRPQEPPGSPPPARLAELDGFSLRIEGEGRILVNGEAVEDDLHGEEISRATSILSAIPEVRERANSVQRETVGRIQREGSHAGVILEGRDIGTVVFPDASHKIFLTADEAVRAERRFAEKERENPGLTRQAVLGGLRERDERDSTREVAPLAAAEDAITIDTSHLDLKEVTSKVLEIVKADNS